jgi:hypothetical protein
MQDKDGWDRQTRKKPAVPCPSLKLLAWKCGFADRLERPDDPSAAGQTSNKIPVLT